MPRTATLVIIGEYRKALDTVLAHRILTVRSAVRRGVEQGRYCCVTKVTVDAERYGTQIASWLTEPKPVPPVAGTLLRVKWS